MTKIPWILAALALAASAFFYLRLEGKTAELAWAEAKAEQQAGAVAALKESMAVTDKVVSAWDKDRTTLNGVRGVLRKEMREAMRDASFKAWADAPVHPDAVRLLNEAAGRSGLRAAPAGPDAAGGAVCPVR